VLGFSKLIFFSYVRVLIGIHFHDAASVAVMEEKFLSDNPDTDRRVNGKGKINIVNHQRKLNCSPVIQKVTYSGTKFQDKRPEHTKLLETQHTYSYSIGNMLNKTIIYLSL